MKVRQQAHQGNASLYQRVKKDGRTVQWLFKLLLSSVRVTSTQVSLAETCHITKPHINGLVNTISLASWAW